MDIPIPPACVYFVQYTKSQRTEQEHFFGVCRSSFRWFFARFGYRNSPFFKVIGSILSSDAIAQPASTGCSSRAWVSPTSILQRKWCLYRQTHCLQMQTLYIRLPCLRALWSLSTRLPNLKIILQSEPSAFKFNLKLAVIFLHKNFRICNRRKQGEPVPLRNFWIRFF